MKAYCIQAEQALVNKEWKPLTMGIKDGKWIQSYKLNRNTYTSIIDPLWIAPGKVHIDLQFPLYQTEYQSALVRRYMFRGATLLVVQCPITSTRNMVEEFQKMKFTLDGLGLDYMIAPLVPLTKLTPEMVRYFGIERVPFLLFQVQSNEEMINKLWGWIAQAQDPSFLPIAPVVSKENSTSYKDWLTIANYHNVRTLPKVLDECPIVKENLRATGIYPYKGEFMYSGDADFNIFRIQSHTQIDTPDQMFYHKAIPCVTVLRGQIIRSHVEVYDMEGVGCYMKASIPNHFMS
ncbi:hypothetical protein IMZ31_10060 [Pontibacillus sp. ALD_SL1]|uniref:hypothetical protein n=1 Tax=Pontibacillus sp. ALD_SL1 TaxID=2777185 RepID=UPI001A96606C|nr:hypothetical protein [Pontibacillus sp. ALD_SL1]QSS98458.1 hypothetical protein IMZ31_10060 [Pontibacillus sp. ALD_SL1]